MQIRELSLAGFRGIQLDPPVKLKLSRITLIVGPNSTSKSSVLEFLANVWNPSWSIEDTYKELGEIRASLVFMFESIDHEKLVRLLREGLNKMEDTLADITKSTHLIEDIKKLKREIGSFFKFLLLDEKAEKLADVTADLIFYALRHILKTLAKNECLHRITSIIASFSVGGKLSLEFEVKDNEIEEKVPRELEEVSRLILSSCLMEIKDDLKSALKAELLEHKTLDFLFSITAIALGSALKDMLFPLIYNKIYYVPSNRTMLCARKIPRKNPLEKVTERIISISPDPDLYREVIKYLKSLGGFTRIRIMPSKDDVTIDLYDASSGEWINISRSAFGACSVLPIVLLMTTLEGEEVVLIDDIELGLHPAAQIRLLDFLIDASNKTNAQLIITTHSGVVFEYILYKVVSGQLKEEDVVINVMYRDPDKKILKSKALRPQIPLELDEELKRALEEFGTSGLFVEQHEIGWKILFELQGMKK